MFIVKSLILCLIINALTKIFILGNLKVFDFHAVLKFFFLLFNIILIVAVAHLPGSLKQIEDNHVG